MPLEIRPEFDKSLQVEIDNTPESYTVDDESKREEIKRVMIRLYKETVWPEGKDDNIDGSGGSNSLNDDLARVNAYKETERELIYNETTRIWADFKARHQHFLSRVQKEFGVNLLPGIIQEYGNTGSTIGEALQFEFKNGILAPVSTGMHIKGKDDNPLLLVLVDGKSGEIVKTGAAATMEVEIVALNGDSNDDEAENSTSGEFSSKIVREWKGKKVLQGKTFVKMKDGSVLLDKISFTHNKDWKKIKNCRLGARPVNADFSASVKPGKTELFQVVDKRNNMYRKREIPFLFDPVYRLRNISHRADCYQLLCAANIKTVMDLLTLHAINPNKLKDILKVHPNTWKTIIGHAQKCKDDKGVCLYHHPRDGQKSHGVVFNISGQLVGLVADSNFVPSNKLPIDKRVDAQQLVVSASEHWQEVVSFSDLPCLISHLLSQTTLNSLQNNLNVVIPQTTSTREYDPTSLTSPELTTPHFSTERCANNKSNRGCGNAGAVGHSQSQSPKRSASNYAFSNSPKKPRDDCQQITPSSPCMMTNTYVTGILPQCQNTNNLLISATTEDDNWLQYIDFSQCDMPARRWKRVCRVVGWISIYSKVRKRRMNFTDQLFETSYDETVFVISASIQHAQT
uniref:uncharacterized protein LOC122608706 isoform X2 n=1 Tax=Erigeron canadensis TaxID=72917 RepID=UPI001CB8F5EE|nr:uncharacterized protein LOC122608706 isoform X2 [Erigeron canadensis]